MSGTESGLDERGDQLLDSFRMLKGRAARDGSARVAQDIVDANNLPPIPVFREMARSLRIDLEALPDPIIRGWLDGARSQIMRGEKTLEQATVILGMLAVQYGRHY